MGLISFTPISDGTTAVAAQVNTPLSTIYNEFNGNIAAANLAANAVTSPKLDPTVNPETRDSERFNNGVGTGLIWTIVSALNGTMSSGNVYISGIRIPITAIASRAYTASKDTYSDVNNTGTIVYTEVANGAAAPGLAANSVRLAKVVTSGAAITGITISGTDSLGNQYRPFGVESRIKTAQSTSAPALTNTSQDLASSGLSLLFNFAEPMDLIVSVMLVVGSTSDFEFRPEVRVDGAVAYTYSPNAALGAVNSRGHERSFITVISVPAGAHTISAGVTLISGTALTWQAGGGQITAIALGRVSM